MHPSLPARFCLIGAGTLSAFALLLLQVHRALADVSALACPAHETLAQNKRVAHRVFDEILSHGHYAAAQGHGTNTGSFEGLPPTGHKVEGRGITVWRMEKGRIKEEWSEFDQATLLKELGAP